MASPYVSYCFAAVILAYILASLLRASTSPLRNVPGPLLARFSRIWLLRRTWKGLFHLDDVKLHRSYGPVVRIAPNQYSVDDPDAVQMIYGSKAGFIKSTWYKSSNIPGSEHPNLFTDQDNGRHAMNRRKVASAYSMTSLVQLEPFINSCTSILRTRLDNFASAGTLVDVGHWMQCYAFDVIGEITLGSRFGFLDAGEDVEGIMGSLHSTLLYAARVGIYPEWHNILFYVNAILNMKGMAYVVQFTQKHVEARLNSNEKLPKDDGAASDFITRFLRIHEENPERLSKSEIWMACMSNIGAGSDTTAVSLTVIIYFLCMHPEVLSKVQHEVDDAYWRGNISDPITFSQAQALPYLQAVIKESLRMHPAAGLPLGRIVPKGGTTVAGQFFPAGATIGINAWVAHRNRDIFGLDADDFRPERWLENADVVKKREAYFMTFGVGTRTCLGKNISLLELSKVIPELVRHYVFEPEHPGRALKTENVWFVRPVNFRCRVRRRNALPKQ